MKQKRISKSRSFPNPPSAAEIKAAREIVTRTASPWEDLDKDPTPEIMEKAWRGDGWHKAEIYFGILIGLQSPFSKDLPEAFSVLGRCPGWRMWQTMDKDIYRTNVQLSARIPHPSGRVDIITGTGFDISTALAICKAGLMLAYFIKEYQNDRKERP